MKNFVRSIKLNVSKVFQALFLSVLLFQIGFGHALAVNLDPTKSNNGTTLKNSAITTNSEEIAVKPTEYQNLNQFQNYELSKVETKKGFFGRMKDKTLKSFGYAKESLVGSVKGVSSFFSKVKNRAFSNNYFGFSLAATSIVSAWFLVSKSSRDWLISKVNSFVVKSKFFTSVKTKINIFGSKVFSYSKTFLKNILSNLKQNTWSASKTFFNAFIPMGIPYINQYFLSPTRAFRESAALQLTEALTNIKNTTILPYIQEKTKGKGKTIAAFGIGATFLASVAIGFLQAGPEVTSVVMTPEKTISSTLALTGKISNAGKDYVVSRVTNPQLFVRDIQSIPEKRRQADQYLSQKVEDFKDTSNQNQADKLGNLTAQVISLVAGSHGADKVSKLNKAEQILLNADKVNDLNKSVKAVEEIKLSLKPETWQRAEAVVKDHANLKHKNDWGTLFNDESGNFNEDMLIAYTAKTMENPSAYAEGFRKTNGEFVKLYWDDRLGTFIIEKEKNPTVFLTFDGRSYFDSEANKLTKIKP